MPNGVSKPANTNRLSAETSPYLLQHAGNPVDWYPWGSEAFAAAKREKKPILLSIGYSACHWCHVMERESFENPEIAALMNEHFVNIKVDREERPDVDHIYMNAVQMLTGRGGWPMTVFMTADGEPFYGGTYFPPEERHGMPSFPRVLRFLAQKYREAPDELEKVQQELTTRLKQLESPAGSDETPGSSLLIESADALARAYDEKHGGLGQAPKFPNSAPLDLFLRASDFSDDGRYLDMTLHTLRRMATGGIYDQLGGGFHRYSVDRLWLVPHFEKMLYDNAQLVPLYLSAYQISGEILFANIARETLDYVVREMRDDSGGFYSSQDADSEGVEGKYFVWDRDEVASILGPDTAEIVCRYWDISEEGNFEARNILRVTIEREQTARIFDRKPDEISAILSAARERLLEARSLRVAPARDEKILTAWNGLMISAFARASEVFGDAYYAEIASTGVAFIERELRRDNRLLATFKDGTAKLNGYLDDYAFYSAALLDVFEALQDRDYLTSATTLVDSMLRHFWDEEVGGFFFTSDDHEKLLVRSKPTFDGSIPSGNSIAIQVLLRLYHHTGRQIYRHWAESQLKLSAQAAAKQPFGMANFIAAADFYNRGPREICIVVDPCSANQDPLVRRVRSTYIPNRVLSLVDPDTDKPRPPLLSGKGQIGGQTTAYVCHHMTCSPPVTAWKDLAELLH